MASDLVAAVISQFKTPFGYKTVIPTDTTSLFATDQEKEAHYLCAIVNSTPVREFIKTYSSAGRGFGAPAVMEHIAIPRFDPRKRIHSRLAELSQRLHDLKTQGQDFEIERRSRDLDSLVSSLFGLGREDTIRER